MKNINKLNQILTINFHKSHMHEYQSNHYTNINLITLLVCVNSLLYLSYLGLSQRM